MRAFAFVFLLAIATASDSVLASTKLHRGLNGLVGRLERRQNRACTPTGPKGGKAAPGLKSPANCISIVPSKDIDNKIDGLAVGSANNWAGGKIPPAMRGIFYMEGNPYDSECFSTGTAFWNSSSKTFDMNQYSPRTWSADPGSKLLAQHLAEGGVIQTDCKAGFLGLLSCNTWFWFRQDNRIVYKGNYDAVQKSTNEWSRSSNIPGTPGWPGSDRTWLRYSYNMYRIVDDKGRRTPEFYSRYLANVGKGIGSTGQFFVHLKDTQEVPQRR